MSEAVYMIGIIDVNDFQTYAEQYGMPVGAMFAEVGAEIIVASDTVEILEGSWPGNWTVIVKVPSAEVAKELYHSDRYAPFRKARIEQLAKDSTLVIVPELDPAGLS